MDRLRGFVLARHAIARRWREAGARVPRPRVLFVLSTDNGGIPHSNADLMGALADDYDGLVLRSDSRAIEVRRLEGGAHELLERHPLAEPIGFGTHVSEEYEAILRGIVLRHAIDLIHVRHLAWHSLNLLRTAHGMDIPVVVSIHDFYAVCPSVNLVDREGVLHRGGITGDAENALWPFDPAAALPMDAERLAAWQRRMEAILLSADAIVAASPSARSLLLEALPALQPKGIEVIPQGRDFREFGRLAQEPSPDSPLRVLLLGNVGVHKGSGIVARIARQAAPGSIEFHLLGTCAPELREWVTDHGPYEREDLAARVAAVRPHVAAVLSLAEETWSHTLTECWALGLPMVAVDRGAVGDRMREHGGGWLLPPDDSAIHAVLARLRGAAAEWRTRVGEVHRWQATAGMLNDANRMARAYHALYNRLLQDAHWSGTHER
jgi:glycosyltransferase involved in cell wall biosynthesis